MLPHKANLVYGVVQAVAQAQRTWLEARLAETKVRNEGDPVLGQEAMLSTIVALADSFVERRRGLEAEARDRQVCRRRNSGVSDDKLELGEEGNDQEEEEEERKKKKKKKKREGNLPNFDFGNDGDKSGGPGAGLAA